jgi:uncharacterized protein YegJ (DUF2314 family)
MRILFLTLYLLAVSTAGCEPADRVIHVHESDAEMNAAIAKARSTLPSFWALFARPQKGESDFALKVKITDSHGVEHFWCTDLQNDGIRISGVVNNDPNLVTSVKLGQRIEIKPDDISDWLYVRGGKMYGNFTVRPLFKSMKPEELAKVKALLAEP